MSDPLRAVLFDVDGTLVDTNYLHAVTWWEAFAKDGHHLPMADIHRAIGMGSDQMLDRLLPADRDRDADSGLRISHDALYATYWTRLRPLPGAVELLRACKARGLAVVLASSAGEAESGVLRAALDAEDAIDDATFSGEVERTKPAPDLVQVALAKAAVPAGQAVFVGDTVWDVAGQPESRSAVYRPAQRRHRSPGTRRRRRRAGLRQPRGVARCLARQPPRRPAGSQER